MKTKYCPECFSKKIAYDAKEKDTYCEKCGLIIDNPKKKPPVSKYDKYAYEDVKICPKCKSRKTAVDLVKARIICENCGIIIKKIPKWPKWMIEKFWKDLEYLRHVEALEKETKYCPECFSKKIAVNWSDEYLYCEKCGLIVKRFKEKKLYKLTKFYKIRPNMMKSPGERAYQDIYYYMQPVAGVLNMDRAKGFDEAIHIWEKLYNRGFTRGRSRPELVGALLDIVARRSGRPVFPNEIIKAADCDTKMMRKFSKSICRKLNIKLPPRDPETFIPRFVSELKLDNKIDLIARRIIKQAKGKRLLGGRSHRAIVGSAIKLACDLCNIEISYKKVSGVVGACDLVLKELTALIEDKIDIKKEK